jgi:hypothetical protein
MPEILGTHMEGCDAQSSVSILSQAVLKEARILEYANTLPCAVGVHISCVPNQEVTRTGVGYAFTALPESTNSTALVVYENDATTAESMAWRAQYPEYNSLNLETQGVLNVQGADSATAGPTDFTGSRIEADKPVVVQLAGSAGQSFGVWNAGGLHMVMHAVAKITLFMCAGAIYVATGAAKVSEMGGAGRRMPIVFTFFLVASVSVIGLPPMGGMWSKLLLVDASFGSGEWLTAAAMIVSSLLTIAYLLPVAFSALFAPAGVKGRDFTRPGGAPGAAIAAAAITAIGCLVLFAGAAFIADYLEPLGAFTLLEAAP